ncbi:MAG: hypothetical protein AABW82_00325 [Nanoarchaeota archaeon]
MEDIIVKKCKALLEAYRNGQMGQTRMPEDSNPGFSEKDNEIRLSYFSLPMALNYQRDSYKLWEAALKTYNDSETKKVFDVKIVASMNENKLREYLTRYKLALQPMKHIKTWQTICKTVYSKFGSFTKLIESADSDFLNLRKIIQVDNKKGFPYLSGPKIFNYWSFIIKEYGEVKLKNCDYIEIAPDTHITQCSVILGIINKDEAEALSKDKISEKWRNALKGSSINPIDMHPPLWFWSRNGFLYKLEK